MASWARLRNRAAAAAQPLSRNSSRPAGRTNTEWRDDQGRTLSYLERLGLDQEADALRSRHAGRTPAGREDRVRRDDTERSPASKRRRSQQTTTTDFECDSSVAPPPRIDSPREAAAPTDPGNMTEDPSDGHAAMGSPVMWDAVSQPVSAGWSGSLLRQPIRMSWNPSTLTMIEPVSDSLVYHGFVQSMSDGACTSESPEYMCWFDDHSRVPVPENVLRRCVVGSGRGLGCEPVTPAAIRVIAACRHVFGQTTMPPCVRDTSDGTASSASVLVFDVKTLRLSRHAGLRSVTDVVDDHAPALVEFFPGRPGDGISASACCLTCHSVPEQRQTSLSSHNDALSALPACRHISAVRHMWRSECGCFEMTDAQVDAGVARKAVRGSALDHQSDGPVSHTNGPPTDEEDMSYPLIYPTADSCHFLILQVCALRVLLCHPCR